MVPNTEVGVGLFVLPLNHGFKMTKQKPAVIHPQGLPFENLNRMVLCRHAIYPALEV
jgi:hypothetical protein